MSLTIKTRKMSRIEKKFAALRDEDKVAFMPFFVAGDPDKKTSLAIIKSVLPRADFLEIGFPYSDPLADGSTIQAADQRALGAGMNTNEVFDLICEIRKTNDIPVNVLVYANLVEQRGIEKFYQDAARAGIDGVLIPDAPLEETDPFIAAARKAGIDPIFLVAKTTSDKRLAMITKKASGFLYLVSVLGVTGARRAFQQDTVSFIKRVRKQTTMPLALGFGVSKATHIQAARKAGIDGVIVGSALVSIIEKYQKNKKLIIPHLEAFIKELLLYYCNPPYAQKNYDELMQDASAKDAAIELEPISKAE